MMGFQLVRGADGDQSEYRFNNLDGEPHIVGGLSSTVRRTSSATSNGSCGGKTRNGGMPRLACTLVAAPTEA